MRSLVISGCPTSCVPETMENLWAVHPGEHLALPTPPSQLKPTYTIP
jgi:hypothetical protein